MIGLHNLIDMLDVLFGTLMFLLILAYFLGENDCSDQCSFCKGCNHQIPCDSTTEKH